MKTFIPFHQVKDRSVIIVDGMHSGGLVLSHWKGANHHTTIAADTSAEIVINAIKNNVPGLEAPLVTATHFDIDGFVGVWSLFNPELALQYEDELKQIATIGDFRELDLNLPGVEKSLQLTCWIDQVERDRFYPPFGAERMEQNEIELCEQKFHYFLEHFTPVLLNPLKYKNDWETAYREVISGYRDIHSKKTIIQKYDHIGLVTIETPEPASYYALFSGTIGNDIVLSIYSNNRYELEYKYTTWVDIVSRPTLPRIDLKPLCELLNAIEETELHWYADKISDTGPILRLENSELSKEERFGDPTKRMIFSSSISPETMKHVVIDFFEKAYKNIQPKRHWNWSEIRNLNKKTLPL